MKKLKDSSVGFRPRRGRPTAAQVEAIEGALLKTARQMFFSQGYDAVAMEAVALALGISKGTLYSRYASKEALFHAVVEDCVRGWSSEAATDDYLLTEDIQQRLEHHAVHVARSMFHPEVRAFNRLLLAVGERFPELNRYLYRTGYLYIVKLISSDIEAAAMRDSCPCVDAESVARTLISGIYGWFLQESAGSEVDLKTLESQALRIVALLMAARNAW
jgi:TetR/AcrR family transcriptional regulator, mexJK operon transcriptional repressor